MHSTLITPSQGYLILKDLLDALADQILQGLQQFLTVRHLILCLVQTERARRVNPFNVSYRK